MSGSLAGFGGSRRCICSRAAQPVDRIEVPEQDRGGDAAPLPVVDALLNPRTQLKAEQARKSAVAASGLDDFPGFVRVHAGIKHHV